MSTVIAPKLTDEEQRVVNELQRLAETWPKHLYLLVNPNSVRNVCVMRSDPNGGPMYDDWSGQTIDAETLIARVSIVCAVGRIST